MCQNPQIKSGSRCALAVMMHGSANYNKAQSLSDGDGSTRWSTRSARVREGGGLWLAWLLILSSWQQLCLYCRDCIVEITALTAAPFSRSVKKLWNKIQKERQGGNDGKTFTSLARRRCAVSTHLIALLFRLLRCLFVKLAVNWMHPDERVETKTLMKAVGLSKVRVETVTT